MRIDPPYKKEETEKNEQAVLEALTRKTAIAVAFVSVFFFFLKLLFL
ncbi:MAG: hypothetical protein ABW019_01855 [Chitinophagaceae bacterium]